MITRHTKLKALKNQFNIPTARKPPSYEVVTSLVCEMVADDPHRRNGPMHIVKQIALKYNIIIPRYVLIF